MKTTATQLVTYWTCPFLWHVSYEIRQPLPVWGSRRRFGNALHAAIAAYERRGRTLESALQSLDGEPGLTPQDRAEARSILIWRHEEARRRKGHPILVEGSLRAFLGGHQLDVRMDRLDRREGGLLLAEYKGGKSVDLRQTRTQLAILAYAIWDTLGSAPNRWQVELLRSRRVLELPAETDPVSLREIPARLIEQILGGDREPRPYDSTFCSGCPAKAYCPKGSPTPKPLPETISRDRDTQLTLF